MMAFTERLIRVEIIEHRAARMLLGISDDLAGLYVQGRTEAEIDARLPRAISEIFEADGKPVVTIRRVVEPPDSGGESVARIRKFSVAA